MSPSYQTTLPTIGLTGVKTSPNGEASRCQITSSTSPRPLLKSTPREEIHDLICVGFGPASLAIAIALHDALDSQEIPQHGSLPKVCFLEKQARFAWHAGMLVPGSKMQISFIKDLATLRNPRSEFTFLNYLKRKDRLVQFANLDTFLPTRLEFEDYMKWCAKSFNDVVEYGQDVLTVTAGPRTESGKVQYFNIRTSKEERGAEVEIRRARNIVIAVGGKPRLSPRLRDIRQQSDKILHSSEYCTKFPIALKGISEPYRFAVIGSGQSAAEIFHNLEQTYPTARTSLIIGGPALKPSDDSPFVNEIFNPDRVDSFYKQGPDARRAAIDSDSATNYGVVRLELLEQIYHGQYMQRIHNPNEHEWNHRILSSRKIANATEVSTGSGRPKAIRFELQHKQTTEIEHLDFDLVVVATGYVRDTHYSMLQDVEHLKPTKDVKRGWTIGRNYKVELNSESVSDDAGLWLQGCNENTHGLSDTLLSILATRGGEMVDSIFGRVQL